MMKQTALQIIWRLAALILLTASCSILPVETEPSLAYPPPATNEAVSANSYPAYQSPTATSPTSNTAQPLPTETAAPALETCEPPPPDETKFSNLRFAEEPNLEPQTTFAGGTEQIFAIWDYENMSADDMIKRIWYRNHEVWLIREETWDIAQYGLTGTIKDISIYDFEGTGLESGLYGLIVCVNNKRQDLSLNESVTADFRIAPQTAVDPAPAPNGDRTALAVGKRLFIQEADGSQWELASATEIIDIAWLPDGEHLIYTNRVYDEHIPNVHHVAHELWLVDLTYGDLSQLSTLAENLHSPQLSPNGRYIELRKGSDYGDACMVDRDVAILMLDENRQRLNLYKMTDFTGSPPDDLMTTGSDLYPIAKGTWQTENMLDIAIQVACLFDDGTETSRHPGIYRFDLTTMTAERIADLPANE